MAWTALFQAVYDSPSNDGSKDAIVIYSDGNREIRRQYNFHQDAYPTASDIAVFIRQQVDSLNKFDAESAQLSGLEIS